MIFYFSGTGNTRWLASRLSNATGERLISIPQAITSGEYDYYLHENERIGICFPVHGWRPPFIVRDFVKRMKLHGYHSQFCFAFATCGDDVGLTFDYLREDLLSVGITLNSIYSVIMPETYNFPYIDQIDTAESAERKKALAAERLERLLPGILAANPGEEDINESRWPRINSIVLGGFFLKHWVTDSKFTVDADACIKCGLCAKTCPVGNIRCDDGVPPQWLHNGLCATCFSCYHHCPSHAIDFAGRTRGKRQYYFKEN